MTQTPDAAAPSRKAEPSRSSGPAPSTSYRRRIIVQILTDYADQFGATNLASERGGGIVEGHANLTSEQIDRIERNGDYYDSYRAVARALDGMQKDDRTLYSALRRTFLTADVGHSDIQDTLSKIEHHRRLFDTLLEEMARLQTEGMNARNLKTYFDNHYTESMRLSNHLILALDDLTSRLEGIDLYAHFPKDRASAELAAKTPRRAATEAHYEEIYAVFQGKCEMLKSKSPDRYRNRALNLTADETGASKPTVERAVRWMEAKNDS